MHDIENFVTLFIIPSFFFSSTILLLLFSGKNLTILYNFLVEYYFDKNNQDYIFVIDFQN